ncbi:TraB/GumN family protein [Treponema phagedenis]|uniref:TraB/GumN family protein n=1 Tax=Treponema phagedenis TaxID=162 RepID=UPI0016558501|nr:TraB/GumN family protein [Treponema phagedenis]
MQTQLDLLSFGTYDDQLYLLKETIKECQDLEDFQANLKKIMQAYVHDDRKELGTLVQSIELLFPEDAPNDLYTRYLEALLYTRNQDWAKKIIDVTAQPGITFIFAGAGHFCGENNVFDILKEKKTFANKFLGL